jgi:hypothetical protein
VPVQARLAAQVVLCKLLLVSGQVRTLQVAL